MADDDDDGNRRKPENLRTPDSSREGTLDWKETCIGVWSRSTKGHQVTDAEPDKICNGISFVVINKHTDLRKVKLSKTRGLQIVVRETEITVPPPKAHDHTYIRVEREEDDKLQRNDEGNGNSTDEQEPSLTRRVMDVMMMKKTNLEKNVEHYKAEGVKLTDVWNGFYGMCSKCYETTARLVSYCHPLEKVSQVFGFAGKCIKKAGGHLVGDDNNEKKK